VVTSGGSLGDEVGSCKPGQGALTAGAARRQGGVSSAAMAPSRLDLLLALSLLAAGCGSGASTAPDPAGAAAGAGGTSGNQGGAGEAGEGGSSGNLAGGSGGDASAGAAGASPGGAAGSGAGGQAGGPACSACEAYAAAVEGATVSEPALTELSGLASSVRHPGVLYAHNDSGDSARFFALSAAGERLATFTLEGLAAVDWEDISVGPCPAGSCVFLGDIGDNSEKRKDYRVLIVPEPELPAAGAGAESAVPFGRVDLAYDDGKSRNSETLMVHPVTGDLYLVTKLIAATTPVFRVAAADLVPGGTATAKWVADAAVPGLVTGGDIHPCGDRLLLRTYAAVFELRAQGAFEGAFVATPVKLPTPAGEPQGEAIAYLPGGGFVTGSEAKPPFQLHVSSCP
jgi:hypothetical protein